jgi:hypothetical protein
MRQFKIKYLDTKLKGQIKIVTALNKYEAEKEFSKNYPNCHALWIEEVFG